MKEQIMSCDYRNDPKAVRELFKLSTVAIVHDADSCKLSSWTTEEGTETWCLALGSYVMYPGRALTGTIAGDKWINTWIVERVDTFYDTCTGEHDVDSVRTYEAPRLSRALAFLAAEWVRDCVDDAVDCEMVMLEIL
jgi:hypothetical protein